MNECQSCRNGGLVEILDLGEQPICNKFLDDKSELGTENVYPLKLAYCPECYLVQLTEVPPLSEVFDEDFNYLSGSTPDHVDHFEQLAEHVVENYQLKEDSHIVDIGSNDGTFLRSFGQRGYEPLGVEPADKPAKIANEEGIPTLNERFETAVSEVLEVSDGDVGAVTGMNVLAHTDDIHGFLEGVNTLLSASDDAIFLSQSHYLPELIEGCEYDTIYHEHARYFTLSSIQNLFQYHDLEVFDVERSDFYGGSIIVYAAHESDDRHVTSAVEKMLDGESRFRDGNTYRKFATKVEENRSELRELIHNLDAEGKQIVGVGAPMKSSTLLNYCGFDNDVIDYITEVNELKIGTYTPGTHIPVVEEERLLEDDPDVALILSWNVADRIKTKLREKGYTGSFVIPIPEPTYIN